MKKRILCAIAAIIITGFWSVGMVNASSQYRQTYIAGEKGIADGGWD